MRTAKFLLLGFSLLLAAAVSASDYKTQDPSKDVSLLARLSYRNTRVQYQATKESQHICLSVYRDGRYRILRTNEVGFPQMQEGKLSHDQLSEMEFLLNTDAFRHLAGTRGALIRESSESFIAEVPRDKNVQRVAFTIADETRRFPKAAERVVQWLVEFVPVNAKTLERTEFPDVCPTMQMSNVDPVAQNFEPSSHSTCGGNQEAR